jgi:hypothetical protein
MCTWGAESERVWSGPLVEVGLDARSGACGTAVCVEVKDREVLAV